jgi:hypothetical protein
MSSLTKPRQVKIKLKLDLFRRIHARTKAHLETNNFTVLSLIEFKNKNLFMWEV